ncbi:MAG: non-ribosomal peptide synthetase [Bacteroidota bacterium]|nr:non-ribosomal peptide synthetase [Bacteroidota bacterium]
MKSLQFASFGFDASCYEIFNTLLSGGSLVLPKKEDLLNEEKFEALINKNDVELVVLPPSFQHIIKDKFGTIKTIVSAGEPLNEAIGKHIQSKGIRLINAYGPTENTICTSLTDDPIKEGNIITIGKPISNVQVYILDKENNLCPVGTIGEMCVAGVQVARGYLNRPELTAEKFIDNPFNKEQGGRLYRTGDLARWLPDGNIEYLGRIDDQVKIRGYRIELGEIENVLQVCKLVKQAVVVAKEDKQSNKRLVGYVVPQKPFNKEDIILYLQTKLPEYMVPHLWVELEQLPLTHNGKIDKKALPNPDTDELSSYTYVAPRTAIEEQLAAIWQELLGVDRVGIYDNFFELGGHSLLAMQMVSHIERKLLFSIPIHILFRFTSISDLSKYLELQTSISVEDKEVTKYKVLDV